MPVRQRCKDASQTKQVIPEQTETIVWRITRKRVRANYPTYGRN